MSDPVNEAGIPIVYPDDDSLDADWPKVATWDLTYTDEHGTSQPVTTVDDLLTTLGVEDYPHTLQKSAVDHFLTLPAAIPMPAQLRNDLATWETTLEEDVPDDEVFGDDEAE